MLNRKMFNYFLSKLKKNKSYVLSISIIFNLIGISSFFLIKDKHKENFVKDLVEVSHYLKPKNTFKSLIVPTEDLTLDIKYKNILKINSDRNKAVENNFFLSNEGTWVSGTGRFDNEKFKFRIRLRGIGNDHWKNEDGLWSYKVKIKDDGFINGIKSFGLMHPRVRNYMNEWYFFEMMKYSGVIAPRYIFLPLKINGNSYPIYAIEEGFDKYLIENNRRREGPIFKLVMRELGKSEDPNLFSKITFYQEKKYKKAVETNNLLLRVERLVNEFYDGKVEASEVFDLDLISKSFAIADIFGHNHSLLSQNIRWYLNPVTGLIEPIPFDQEYLLDLRINGMIGENNFQSDYLSNEKSDFMQFNFVDRDVSRALNAPDLNNALIKQLLLDKNFQEKYIEALELISKKDFLDNFFKSVKDNSQKNLNILRKSYPSYDFKKNKDILYRNQVYIDSFLNPKRSLSAFSTDLENNKMIIKVANVHSFPVKLISINNKSGDVLFNFEKPIYLPNRPMLCVEFECLERIPPKLNYKKIEIDLSKSKVKIDKLENLIIKSTLISGNGKYIIDPIFNKKEISSLIRNQNYLETLPFLYVIEKEKSINFRIGTWNIDQPLIIPKGYKLNIPTGTNINLINNSYIVSYDTIKILGTKLYPVNIYSSDKTGKGIAVYKSSGTSNIKFLNLSNMNSISYGGIELMGAINFYESDCDINNLNIFDNFSEDGINIIRSNVRISNSTFRDIYSDAIDLDFSKGILVNLTFENIGNDGLDFSGTTAEINNIFMKKIGDKGISAGEKSEIMIDNIEIDKSFIGIASKDSSYINGDNISINNSEIGLASYKKKPEYSKGNINLKNTTIINSKNWYLLEEKSAIKFNGKNLKINSYDIYNQIYVKE